MSAPEPSAEDLARGRLSRAADALGYPAGAADRLAEFVAVVLAESERVNLTGAKTLAEALDVLALDSLPVSRAWDAGRPVPRLAIDLGTGNGLPGVAVALLWPGCRVVLVERRAKKAKAVERCLAAAAITGCEVVACDGRELVRYKPDLGGAADLVTARAVGELAPVAKEAAPWLAKGARLVHWKPGALSDEERRAGEEAARRLGLAVRPDVEFRSEGAAAPRRLVVYERPA